MYCHHLFRVSGVEIFLFRKGFKSRWRNQIRLHRMRSALDNTIGRICYESHLTGSFGRSWCWTSDLEIRQLNDIYHINPDAVWRHKKNIPTLKRNGFKGDFNTIAPIDLFTKLLTDNSAEILFKAGQTALFKRFLSHGYGKFNYCDRWPL
mgnify:CR=1 FL=1